jgi:5,10-methylenetetrahydrofolate reductase
MRKAADKGPEFEEEEGIALSLELAKEMVHRVRGLHVMPMGRYGVVKRILEALA